jgi:hypothetical protein
MSSDQEYEEGSAGTESGRRENPLKEYLESDLTIIPYDESCIRTS